MLKILTITFSLMLAFLIGRLWIGNGSYPKIWHMKEQIKDLSEANKNKLEENRKLEAELQQFKEGTNAIEARARSEFGMIKRGETFYQIILDPEKSTIILDNEGNPILSKKKLTPMSSKNHE